MAKPDDLTGNGFLVDKILDKTGMKGTGRWTIQEAAERSVPAPTMAAALDMRYMSGRKEERVAASSILRGPTEIPNVERSQIIEDAKNALYCAKICSYAQGMCLIKAASDQVLPSLPLTSLVNCPVLCEFVASMLVYCVHTCL
jgi:6-phosphogluconate dehydrogenase